MPDEKHTRDLSAELDRITIKPSKNGKWYHCNYCKKKIKKGQTKRHRIMHARNVIAQFHQRAGTIHQKEKNEVMIDANGYADCKHCGATDYFKNRLKGKPQRFVCYSCKKSFILIPRAS